MCGGQGLRGAYFLALYLGYRTFLNLVGLTGSLLCMQLSNPASAAGLVMTNHTRYAVPWQPIWPSITVEANATVRSTFMKVDRLGGHPLIPPFGSQHIAACSAAWLPDMPTAHGERSALRCCSIACNFALFTFSEICSGKPQMGWLCWQDAVALASHPYHNRAAKCACSCILKEPHALMVCCTCRSSEAPL